MSIRSSSLPELPTPIQWAVAIAIVHCTGEPMDPNSQTSLYQRLGGYDVIAAVIDELFAHLRADPQFGRFAGGRSDDSQARARQLLVEQLCALTGGPCATLAAR